MPKKYLIERVDDGSGNGPVHCVVENKTGIFKPLGVTRRYMLPHVERHSPEGFNFGYFGSGPADLSLSILCDHFNETPNRDQVYHGQYQAAPVYQRFKELFIGSIKGNSGTITTAQIEAFLSGPEIKLRLGTAPTEVNDAELE